MNGQLRGLCLKALDTLYAGFARAVLFRLSAQKGHDWTRGLLFHVLDRVPHLDSACAKARRSLINESAIQAGGASLSQSLILAAGALKGEGFPDEAAALDAVVKGRNVIAGWRIVPALVGPIEFGSFTRQPRLGNPDTVLWRREATRSTQNLVGLRNPGARAAACFLSMRPDKLPREYGINLAPTPGQSDIERQTRDLLEALAFFLDAGLKPTWFTLNLSCPNTEDDPQGYQLEAETRRLCGAMVACLRARQLEIPLWVKVGPGLASAQYRQLMRVFHEIGVAAVVATNTQARPSPDNATGSAGVGGGELLPGALEAVRQLLAEKNRMGCAVDVIACGGILDGDSLHRYRELGVKAAQYWSAVVYRGPLAAAIIEHEHAQLQRRPKHEAIHRESLA